MTGGFSNTGTEPEAAPPAAGQIQCTKPGRATMSSR